MTAVFATACSLSLGPDFPQRVPGVISFYDQEVVVEVPDVVTAGEDFQVRIRTYGGGCITQGSVETSVVGMRADVAPYDIESGADVCTEELRMFDHVATLNFEQAGPAVVVFTGQRRPENQTVTLSRSIEVESQ